MRPIDADALLDFLDVGHLRPPTEICFSELMMKNIIDIQPTVDAVPVIRCYECKYFREFEKGFSTDWDGSCKYWNTHSTVYGNFCGCAERETDDV